MSYILMTVVDEHDQTLSGPLPTPEFPGLGEMVHGFGRIVSLQTYPGDRGSMRVVAKVDTGHHRSYAVREIRLNDATLIVPVCLN